MGSIGMPEILLIFLVILLVFGAKRIPEIARGLGKGIREFKDATTDIKRELTIDDAPPRVQPPQHAATPYSAPYSQTPAAPPVAAPAPAPAPAAESPAPERID